MDLIAKGTNQNIYEDNNYWVLVTEHGKVQILKTQKPYYPLSAVAKHGYTPVNISRLEELNEQLTDAVKNK